MIAQMCRFKLQINRYVLFNIPPGNHGKREVLTITIYLDTRRPRCLHIVEVTGQEPVQAPQMHCQKTSADGLIKIVIDVLYL